MKIRDLLIPYVLKFLARPRSVDCDRAEFFSHATCFATLIKIGHISLEGECCCRVNVNRIPVWQVYQCAFVVPV